jgi:hypothetical protein
MVLFKYQSSTKKFNHVLVIDHTWRYTFVKILLYFDYNTWNYCTILAFKKKLAKWPFYVHKMVKIHHKKNHWFTSLIIILKVSIFLDKVYNSFKIFQKF